ncbi:MAG: spherulation-specific family 4 protein [Candidatus Colwellbacteria bacterium]|nr:spherulation-specific family 4 protein [Candidatus Colwellbacteria bacterium]
MAGLFIWKGWLAIVSLVIIPTLSISMVSAAEFSSAECQSAIIPAYFYPGSEWDRTLKSLNKEETAIFNPASGAGKKVNPDYVKLTDQASARGADLAGYVYVEYGKRDIDSVRAEIDNYYDWYKTSSIFIDGASSDKEDIAYYEYLADYIREKGGKVILNPGTVPDEEYMSIVDLVIVTEGKYADYINREFPEWMSKYPASKFGHLVYEVPEDSLSKALELSKKRNAGFIYLTDDGGGNPWDKLPTYWQEELRTKCPTYNYGVSSQIRADIQTKAAEWVRELEKMFADMIVSIRNFFISLGWAK